MYILFRPFLLLLTVFTLISYQADAQRTQQVFFPDSELLEEYDSYIEKKAMMLKKADTDSLTRIISIIEKHKKAFPASVAYLKLRSLLAEGHADHFYKKQSLESYKMLEGLKADSIFVLAEKWLQLMQQLQEKGKTMAFHALDTVFRKKLVKEKNLPFTWAYREFAKELQQRRALQLSFPIARMQLLFTKKINAKDNIPYFLEVFDAMHIAAEAGLPVLFPAAEMYKQVQYKTVQKLVLDYHDQLYRMMPILDLQSIALEEKYQEDDVLKDPRYRRRFFDHYIDSRLLRAKFSGIIGNPGYALTEAMDIQNRHGRAMGEGDTLYKAYIPFFPLRLSPSQQLEVSAFLASTYFQIGNYTSASLQQEQSRQLLQENFASSTEYQKKYKEWLVLSVRIYNAAARYDSAGKYLGLLKQVQAKQPSSSEDLVNDRIIIQLLEAEYFINQKQYGKTIDLLETIYKEHGKHFTLNDNALANQFYHKLYWKLLVEDHFFDFEETRLPDLGITTPNIRTIANRETDEYDLLDELALRNDFQNVLYDFLLKKEGYGMLTPAKTLLKYLNVQVMENFLYLHTLERSQYYQNRLMPYLDLYHSLLFSDSALAAPFTADIQALSLFLKNSLHIENTLPHELYYRDNDPKGDERYYFMLHLKRLTELYTHAHFLNPKYSVHDGLINMAAIDARVAFSKTFDKGKFITHLGKLQPDTLSRYLQDKEMTLEYIRYKDVKKNEYWYGATIMKKDQGIVWKKSLFSENDLLRLMKTPSSSVQSANLAVHQVRGAGEELPVILMDSLYELIIRPLEPILAEAQTLYFIPDGLLNRISFHALKDGDNYFFRKYQLQQLSSLMQLMPSRGEVRNDSILLVGGVDYNKSEEMETIGKTKITKKEFFYLPGTNMEMREIAAMAKSFEIPSLSYSGAAVIDSLFQNLENYKIIHVATHGFYHPDQGKKLPYTLRCGIAVSGANCSYVDTEHIYCDGIVYAYELMYSDLSDCELFTLSACETALGDAEGNIGVMGIPHALKAAGVRHILVSLWKVPDMETSFFMKKFYGYYFAGKTLSEALRHTQQDMSGSYPVSAWAGFTLIK